MFKGLASDLIGNGISILQYADDTIFLLEDNFEFARNLKFILCMFEHLTGLKINFHKSEAYCFGESVQKQDEYAKMFS